MAFLTDLFLSFGYESTHDLSNNYEPEENEDAAFELVIDLARHFSNKYLENVPKYRNNIVACSPLSVFIILSMLSYGAEGATRSQLLNAIGLPRNKSKIALLGFQRLMDILTNNDLIQLQFNAAIFVPIGIQPKPEFIDLTKKFFRTEIKTFDFQSDTETVDLFNEWFHANMPGHNAQTMHQYTFGNRPEIVIATAVYFKGIWKSKFNPAHTLSRPFYSLHGGIIDVPTMYKYGLYRWGVLTEINASFIEIPYKSVNEVDGVSMFVILPNDSNAYRELTFNSTKFNRMYFLKYPMRHVHLYLPKFTIQSRIPFDFRLRFVLGLSDTFGILSNFSGISDSPGLNLRYSPSQVNIVMDEQGDVGMESCGTVYNSRLERSNDEMDAIEFKVDRPFLAIIATTGNNYINLLTIPIM